MATILSNQKVNFTYDEVAQQTLTPKLKGSLQLSMKATARQYGLIPYEINKNLKSVLRELTNDTPVIVLLNLGLKPIPVWHYSVLTGFDKADKKIFLSAPKGDETWMTFDEFETFFERGGNWAIVALKPPSLPVSADEQEVIKAILDMYDTGAKDIAKHALVSYLSRNPSSYLGIVALANMYFSDGDFKSASFMYEQALDLKPKDPAMLNNLAESLLKQNRPLEARKYVLEAISIGGTFLQNYKNTLQEIETMLRDKK